MNRNKKAQEEIVGFVAIVVLVVAIALVFFIISADNTSTGEKESSDIHRFLQSATAYTSECAFGYEPNYADVRDLLKSCYQEPEKTCVSGKKVCIALNETLRGILESSFNVNNESKIRAFIFTSSYSINNSVKDKEIVSFKKGNCDNSTYAEGNDFFSNYPGVIRYSLRLCY